MTLIASGNELINELQGVMNNLDQALLAVKKRGQQYAKAERDYRVILRKEIITARADGMPVTIISDICRGKEEIANMKMQRDIAESLYDSAKEAINTYKLQARLLESQISREWGLGR